jgi:hypothetical protein
MKNISKSVSGEKKNYYFQKKKKSINGYEEMEMSYVDRGADVDVGPHI